MQYYKVFDVWVRRSESMLVRYRCLEVLPDKGFCVQSKDFYYSPFKDVSAIQLDVQFLELLAESSPESRAGLFETLEQALRAHDDLFEN